MVVAQVEIAESNGALETVTVNVSNLNFGSIDAANLPFSSNPITAVQNSFEKYFRYNLININTSNKIDNFQVFLTPAPTVLGITYKTNIKTAPLVNSAYVQPTASTSIVATLTFPSSDPGAENVGVAGASGGLTGPNTFSDYIVAQLQTTGSSPPGDLPQKTFHFEYDEQ